MLTQPAVALFLSIAGMTWLDVPFIKQSKNDCGPASIWMVVHYWMPSAATGVDEIHKSVFSKQAAGVNSKDMGRYLATSGFQVWTFSGSWNDLSEGLSNGRPLIVALRGSPLHYVVVAGIDTNANLVFLNDPASRKLRAMHRYDFEAQWSATRNWTLLAVPLAATANDPARSSSLTEVGDGGSNPDLLAASSAFRRGDYPEAKRDAHRAGRADPLNNTTNELLATLYLLDDNVEAALKYWNRTGQPALRNVDVQPKLRVDPVVLDREFAFSRGSVMTMDDFLQTRRRLEQARFLSTYAFDFSPVEENRYDVTLRATDASGSHYFGWLRGLPYQTVRPQRTNLAGRTFNLDSLVRWDRQKRRLTATLDSPLGSDGSIRFSASADARDEQWDFRGSSFSVRRIDASIGLESPIGSRGTWTTALTAGTGRLGQRASADFDLFRWPERRLVVSGGIRAEIGRDRSSLASGPPFASVGAPPAAAFLQANGSPTAKRFAKGEPSIRMRWLPKARGSDFETTLHLRAGRTSHATPVDELFIAGLDRDSDLTLRAHPSYHEGRKGSGPIGNRYVLLNAETDKILHDFGVARVSAGPVVDVARMSKLYIDSGVVLRLSLGPAMSMSFSLSRDLRSGHTIGFLN